MTDSSRGYQQFFAEMKRRRVFRVMAVYGATAFMLLFGGCWMGRQGTPEAARSYQAARTADIPTIDGRLDEIAWANAPTTELFVDIRGRTIPTRPGRLGPESCGTTHTCTWVRGSKSPICGAR